MTEEKKEKIINTLYRIVMIAWVISIAIGALIGNSDGSTLIGIFVGFLIGLGIAILNAFIVNIIDEPQRLKYFLILLPSGFLIGLIWGLNGGLIGLLIGGIIAFLFVADLIKKD